MNKILFLMVVVVALSGCDSKQWEMMNRRIAVLEEKVETMSERVDSNVNGIADYIDRMKNLSDRLVVAEMTLRRLSGVEDAKTLMMNDSTICIKDIVKRIDTLEKQLRGCADVLLAVENSVNNNQGQNNKVSSDDYGKLVSAHNRLVSSVNTLIDKVRVLDDCVNSPLGDVEVSPSSWLKSLRYDVDELKWK